MIHYVCVIYGNHNTSDIQDIMQSNKKNSRDLPMAGPGIGRILCLALTIAIYPHIRRRHPIP